MLCTISELSKSPDIQEDVYKEICAAPTDPDGLPTSQTFQTTPLLRGVVKESLRYCVSV